MTTIRLTVAQAVTRYLTAQKVEIDGAKQPLLAGVWAIFAHGNVPIPVLMTFHEPERGRFYTKLKTITTRWSAGIRAGADCVVPTMQ